MLSSGLWNANEKDAWKGILAAGYLLSTRVRDIGSRAITDVFERYCRVSSAEAV
jgi:hypothetical protein